MHLIVYNCIRALIAEAAEGTDVKTRRISFKGSVQAIRQWEPYLNQINISSQEQKRLIRLLYEPLAKVWVDELQSHFECAFELE